MYIIDFRTLDSLIIIHIRVCIISNPEFKINVCTYLNTYMYLVSLGSVHMYMYRSVCSHVLCCNLYISMYVLDICMYSCM